jgi:hypothetical protein
MTPQLRVLNGDPRDGSVALSGILVGTGASSDGPWFPIGRTDETGSLRVTLPPGHDHVAPLEVYATRLSDDHDEGALSPRVEYFAAHPMCERSFVVRTPNGEPVRGAQVESSDHADSAHGGDIRFPWFVSHTTDHNGKYTGPTGCVYGSWVSISAPGFLPFRGNVWSDEAVLTPALSRDLFLVDDNDTPMRRRAATGTRSARVLSSFCDQLASRSRGS